MKLTGQCKIDFEEWLNNPLNHLSGEMHHFNVKKRSFSFNDLTSSMKWGVYVDFFDSVKIMIELQLHVNPTMQGGSFKCIRPAIFSDGRFHNVGASFGTRERARTAAIKKANEIHNAQ